tara:strand:- start:6669 stop:7058 length:390 start_codon:yes stop_codon:yes gene_type:complete
MKQSDIDKRVKELTEEAQILEMQGNILRALDTCMEDGHLIQITSLTDDGVHLSELDIQCSRCGATVEPINGLTRWSFGTGHVFEGMFVDEVYEPEEEEKPEPVSNKKETVPTPDLSDVIEKAKKNSRKK